MSEDAPNEPGPPAGWAGRPWLFALVLLGLLGLVAGVVVYGTKPRLYVDPSVEGDAEKYREIISVAKPAPEKKEAFLDSPTVTRTNNRVRVEFPGYENSSSRLLDYQLQRAKVGESIQLPKGPLELKYQSIGYGEFPAEKLNEYAAPVESRHFDLATGKELDEKAAEEQLQRVGLGLRYRGVFPTVKFLLTFDPEEELKVVGYSLFDARTKASLSSGYSWGSQDGTAYVEMEVKKWHAGPVELVVDLATSPVERVEFPPEEGAIISQPSWELHLAAVVEGDSNGSSSGSDGTNSYVEIRFRQNEKKNRKETAFMFLGNPWAYHLPVDLEAWGKNGKKLSSAGGGSSSRYMNKSIRGSLDEVDHLRALIYKDVRRVVFELPTIQGLPEQNENLSNLFDVRVPYLRIKTEWELREAIEGLTQLRFGGRVPVFKPPAGYFPAEFRNVTPRELLDEYLAYGPKPQAVAIDEEKRRFVLEPPLLERLGKKIGKIFKK